MNKDIIVKSKAQIKNKWFETKEDELDVSLNIIAYLEQQVKKQKEAIDNAIAYVEHRIVEDDYMLSVDTNMVQKELLDILKEK